MNLCSRSGRAVLVAALGLLSCTGTKGLDTEANETGSDTQGDTAVEPLDRVILGQPEEAISGLQSALHILAMDNGEVIIAESREAPETTGRLTVLRSDGSLQDLVTGIPLVYFTHDVRYLGPNGFTLLPGGEELMFSVFLGAGNVVPVDPGPNWDPNAGSNLYRVPLFDSDGAWREAVDASQLELWANVPHAFLYDIVWKEEGVLVATEPGQNSLFEFEDGASPQAVILPLEEIPIEPVDGQKTVESVPCGIDLLHGVPLVGHLGGGLKDDQGNPTGQPFDQRVGRVTRLERDGPVVIADGLPSVMDVVVLDSGQVLLICWDYYMRQTEGFILELRPDGTTEEIATLQDFPVSASASDDALYVVNLQGTVLRYELDFEAEEPLD